MDARTRLGQPQELAAVRGRLGLPIERDLHFRAEKRLSAYARDSRWAADHRLAKQTRHSMDGALFSAEKTRCFKASLSAETDLRASSC